MQHCQHTVLQATENSPAPRRHDKTQAKHACAERFQITPAGNSCQHQQPASAQPDTEQPVWPPCHIRLQHIAAEKGQHSVTHRQKNRQQKTEKRKFAGNLPRIGVACAPENSRQQCRHTAQHRDQDRHGMLFIQRLAAPDQITPAPGHSQPCRQHQHKPRSTQGIPA